MFKNADLFWASIAGLYRETKRQSREANRLAASMRFRVKDGEATEYQTLLSSLQLDDAEFKEKYINPFKGKDPHLLAQIMNAITAHISPLPSGQDLLFEVKLSELQRALDWTFVHFAEIKPFDIDFFEYSRRKDISLINEDAKLDDFWKASLSLEGIVQRRSTAFSFYIFESEDLYPFCQCFFCGRPDVDGRGKHFKKSKPDKIWYCHTEHCQTSGDGSGSSSNHDENCCFRRWSRYKEALRKRLKFQRTDELRVSVLREEWDRRLEANRKMKWDIRNFTAWGKQFKNHPHFKAISLKEEDSDFLKYLDQFE